MPSTEETEHSSMLSPTMWAMLQGQWISILIAGTGIFASMLSDANANFPLLMSLGNYGLLCIFLVRYYLRQRTQRPDELVFTVDLFEDEKMNKSAEDEHVPVSKWIYLLAAILDVEANFLVIEAYNYTSITSVMLLDCFTIPCAMVLSYFFLGCRYRWKHGLGTVLCLIGLICIVINDVVNSNNDDSHHSNALLGDILCLSGAVLYASSNVMQETLVKFHDRDQYLGFMGGFGVIVAFIQFMIVDFAGVQQTTFTWGIIGSTIGFILCLFFMYTNTSSYLQESDAILFNLSLLTSDVYAVIFTYFFYGYLVDWLYFLAFGLVIVGLIFYHSEKPPLQVGQENQSQALYPQFLIRFTSCVRLCNTQAKSFIPLRTDSSHGDSSEHRQHSGSTRNYQAPNRFDYNPILPSEENDAT